MLALQHIFSKVRSSPLDICFDSYCLSCVLVLALVVDKVLFAEVVFSTEMELVSATKYETCGIDLLVTTGPSDVVRVGKNCANSSLAHRRDVMLGAAERAVTFFSFGPASNVPKLTHYGVV